MHRRALLRKLAEYQPVDREQRTCRDQIITFVERHARCFERSLTVGHVTGSAWLLNRDGSHVLLTHHRKLGKWLQLGGHADGETDILAVALREAREESGLASIEPVFDAVFDVDIHAIPANGPTPAHDHFDIRFLLRTTEGDEYRVSDESHELAWVTPDNVPKLTGDPLLTDESVLRMNRKWMAHLRTATA